MRKLELNDIDRDVLSKIRQLFKIEKEWIATDADALWDKLLRGQKGLKLRQNIDGLDYYFYTCDDFAKDDEDASFCNGDRPLGTMFSIKIGEIKLNKDDVIYYYTPDKDRALLFPKDLDLVSEKSSSLCF